jgi:hypothetical protein
MAHWVGLERAARVYAANTPDFLAETFVHQVQLSGSVTAYAIQMGHNLHTQRGEEALNFLIALYMFSADRCLQGLGLVPYRPIPLLGGPPPGENGHVPVNNPPPQNQGPAVQPVPDAAPEEAVPMGPAPPVGDLNGEEIDDMLNVIMLD